MKKKTFPAFSPGLYRLSFLSLFLILITAAVSAQTVTGKILDNEKKPVDGATVTVKGTSRATSSNASGNFTISARANDILVISYIGFATLEVPVSGRNDISISLFKGDGTDYNEVIVTALGVRRASKKLGYATTIDYLAHVAGRVL